MVAGLRCSGHLGIRMTAPSMFEKVWRAHAVTSPQVFTLPRLHGLSVRRPDRSLTNEAHRDIAEIIAGGNDDIRNQGTGNPRDPWLTAACVRSAITRIGPWHVDQQKMIAIVIQDVW